MEISLFLKFRHQWRIQQQTVLDLLQAARYIRLPQSSFATIIILAVIFSITQHYNLLIKIVLRSVVDIFEKWPNNFSTYFNNILVSGYPGKFHRHILNYNDRFSNEKGHINYASLSLDFEWKPQLKMVLIYQVWIKQCLKKVFPIFNDFFLSGSGLLKNTT